MKRIYLVAAAFCAVTLSNAQVFWTHTTYRGAFPVTDNTPATDWTDGWTNFDPESTVYGAPVTTISSDITSNTTWSGTILLQNKVYVKNGAVLTIQPGTVIRGDKSTQATLIITRGAKIMAAGTASAPIVFTSNEPEGNRAEGDWGGVVILGKATNNQPGGVANIEGIAPAADTEFGGSDDNDNSGQISYVRIEFAGIALQPNKEINGITFGSVGRATRVDHVQVSFSGDDSFEWFGGTVNASHLVSYRGIDDDFDTDFGFRGNVQFGLVIRDPNFSDAAGDSNAFESDNDATGSSSTPMTQAIFSNFTIIGPKGNGSVSLPLGETFEKSFRIRRNSGISVCNSISAGWQKGLSIEGSAAEGNFTSGAAKFAGNILAGYSPGSTIVTAAHSFYSTFFGSNGNDSTVAVSQLGFAGGFTALGTKPDFRLSASSPAASGAVFASSLFGHDFVGLPAEKRITGTLVSPNPSDQSVTLTGITGEAIISICDLTGKQLPLIMYKNTSGEAVVSTTDLQNGVYFVLVETTSSKETVKLIVRH